MTLTNVQKNAVSSIQQVCSDLVLIRTKLTWLAEVYTAEELGDIATEEFAAVPSFAHITDTEFQAAMTALASINTALNAGTPAAWTKLLKISETMPR